MHALPGLDSLAHHGLGQGAVLAGLEPGVDFTETSTDRVGVDGTTSTTTTATALTWTDMGSYIAAGDGPTAPSGLMPFGADYTDGSEFMIGDVWVSLVLLESDGSLDANKEDWTATEIAEVKSEVADGLAWWEHTFDLRGSNHDLNFFIDTTYANNPVKTKYEPIARSSYDEDLWIGDFLSKVGYNSSSSVFTNLDQWNDAQRQAHNTNWAYTMFVVDSSADSDGKFSDGWAAFAYRGGPYLVLTYDNAGWGIGNMDKIAAHETGHIFYAMDEYKGGGSYYSYSGYYNTQNLNAYDNNPNPSSRVASLMAEASLLKTAWTNYTSSPSSLEMVGWKDSDGDKVFDVMDVPLKLTGTGSFDAATMKYIFSGNSSVQVLDNLNPKGSRHDITLNTVDRVQYRLDGGAWVDGASYGKYSTAVAQSVAITTAGNHTIEFRTVANTPGVASNVWSHTFSTDQSSTNQTTTPGIDVSPVTGLSTSESGAKASFQVVLKSKPTADVVIDLASNDSTEGVVSTSSLTFTATNWNVAQTVYVTGVDDTTLDGNVSYKVLTAAAKSSDALYNGLNAADVSLTNQDNERKTRNNKGGGNKAPGAFGGEPLLASSDLTSAVLINRIRQQRVEEALRLSRGNATDGLGLSLSKHDDRGQPWDALANGYTLKPVELES